MTHIRKTTLALAASALLAAPLLGSLSAQAEEMNHDMSTMSMSAESPATKGYMAAMDKMHQEMMGIDYSGDADRDFVLGMIPHHQAAVDMAKVLLENGKDPELRKMAQDIIAAQEKEIAVMENWLAAHPAK
ncbi:CopM family metallochaperone [Manganibacter manganicus]|uniref:DUF305 domain-containing protein n=1 Tax=Manganibacter manganicus TaxID=1873176 RepID=A0A1V8RL80_9HYPH|nr:DUF305 domain-containing protein [Pseudaminobacter manganicus]OQM73958.1 DUF305 domain-containing protein [Pseudaminobacter manganicus]